MNQKILLFSLLVAVVGLFSCADDELSPIITFDKATKGAYIKLLNESDRLLDLANLGSAKYDYCVEFVDLEAGSSVAQYDINVTFIDNNDDNGDNSAGPILLRSINSSEFNSTDRNFAGSCVSITLSDLLSAFNLDAANLKANDQFQFSGSITTTDGAVYAASNSDPDVRGAAFGGHFDYTLKATCPLPDDLFTGTYQMSYEEEPTGGFGPIFGENPPTVEVTATGPTTRLFEATWAPQLGFAQTPSTIEVDFICESTVLFSSFSANLQCSSPIMIGPDGLAPVDINDDSEFRVKLLEFSDDGGCGADPAPVTLIMTKQ